MSACFIVFGRNVGFKSIIVHSTSANNWSTARLSKHGVLLQPLRGFHLPSRPGSAFADLGRGSISNRSIFDFSTGRSWRKGKGAW
jgi:hypothetical protein